jgi:hypothetical protein
MQSFYEQYVKGKNSEQLLDASAGGSHPVQSVHGEYFRISAQVRSTQELMASLDRASTDNGKLGSKVLWLTVALVCVGSLQAVAAAWPYLADWGNRHGIHLFS